MQIIESTAFGVRSAVIYLEAGDNSPRFILFPMVHVGEPTFYDEIADRLEDCDLVLCEGVNSPTVSLLTSSYRYFANQPRLGLVSQHSMKLDHLEERLIHADVVGAAFEKRWSTLPIFLRLILPIAAPIYGLYLRYFVTREYIAKFLGTNLRKSRTEILVGEFKEKSDGVLIDWRDQHLLTVLEHERLKHENTDASIGVLFGAAHMRSVIWHLVTNSGYRVMKAEWVRVFGI